MSTGKVIAIDFDGTLFEECWPGIGAPIWPVINAAKAEQKNGTELILWTTREGEKLQDAVNACEHVGLHFDTANANSSALKAIWGNDPRKIGATEYWNDRAVNVRSLIHKDGSAGEIVKALREKVCGYRAIAADLIEKQQARIAELKQQLSESQQREQAEIEENDFRRTIQLVPLYTCGGHGYSDDDDENFWCPICRAHLGTHRGYVTTCPRCGQSINPEFDPEWDYQAMEETTWDRLPKNWSGPQEAGKGDNDA